VPVVLAVVLAIICCVVVVAEILLQVALLLGAPLGHLAWGGEDYYLQPPLRKWALLSILGYAVSGLVVLQGADVFTFEGKIASIILTSFFVLLYFAAFVLSSRSRNFAERNLNMIIHLGLAALFLVVAVIGHLNA
jgi:hypothetical protein